MKRLWLILFALPLIAQNQWGNTEVQDPCNNQEYLILKQRVETKGANDLMPIKNGVIDFEKYEYYRHYDKLCLEYKKNPCGYIDYQNLKKKGVVNLTASEFETYKILKMQCCNMPGSIFHISKNPDLGKIQISQEQIHKFI